MSGFEGWLASLDPDHLAALFFGFCVLVFIGGMVVSIVTRLRQKPTTVRATMPTTAARKSGRVRRG